MQNPLIELAHLKFHHPVKQQVYWGEMDAYHHINNVIYFRYFETGRATFLEKTNLWKLFKQDAIKIVVAKLDCNFVREIKFPEEIEISVALKKVGNSSLVVHHKVTDSKGNICAHGEGIIVATNPEIGKSTPWTENIRVVFDTLL